MDQAMRNENVRIKMNQTGEEKEKKLGLGLLIALGVGSMIGGGVFNSPTDLITVANPQTILLSWFIGGFGVLALALIFQLLAEKRPELEGGIYSYARAGYGDFMGFLSAWGYWTSGVFGNVAFFTLIIKTLNSLLGPQYQLQPIVSFILASIVLWGVVYIQTRGTKSVGIINAIVTVAKLIPLTLVVLLGFLVFKPELFAVANWQSTLASVPEPAAAATTLGSQINGAMGVILWCFIGVEASTILAEKAESQKIVGKATVISLLFTLGIYIAISVVAMGVLSAEQLAQSGTPLASVLGSTVIGDAGAIIVKLGIIVSVLGALISWVLIASQLPYIAAKEGVMPKMFVKTNKLGAPVSALLLTNGIAQVFLLVLLSTKLQSIYNMVLLLATTCILIPYLLSALYSVKVCRQDRLNAKSMMISIIGVVYSVYVILAVGIVYLAASFIIYALGMFAFIKAKKEQKEKVTKAEWIGVSIVSLLGIVTTFLLAIGIIAI
ncbi:basic amino acid/polyamine antiporter [Bacillus tuaregi]|uniref:basic amino acid/polyamine antiporter n=1 Tax=Bacillus tuaregi TaxID=1816695 RepID=UPI000B1D0A7E|nr:basic amino acid/polyamine antiporter [Bacillus tuaregi]